MYGIILVVILIKCGAGIKIKTKLITDHSLINCMNTCSIRCRCNSAGIWIQGWARCLGKFSRSTGPIINFFIMNQRICCFPRAPRYSISSFALVSRSRGFCFSGPAWWKMVIHCSNFFDWVALTCRDLPVASFSIREELFWGSEIRK